MKRKGYANAGKLSGLRPLRQYRTSGWLSRSSSPQETGGAMREDKKRHDMLRNAYRKHLSARRPQSVHKFALDAVFEERLLEIKDERVLDFVQLLAYEVLMLRDLNSLMSERLISAKAPNEDSAFFLLIKKYVRVFPYWEKAVICPLAEGCARACKCSEMSDKAFMFDFKPN